MKKTTLPLALCLMFVSAKAQVNITGTLRIEAGTGILSTQSININPTGTLNNAGNAETLADLTINGNASGAGATKVSGNLTAAPASVTNLNLTLQGEANSTLTTNGNAIANLSLNKSPGQNTLLADNLTVGTLTFSADNNKLDCNGAHTVTATTVASFDNNEYITTGEAGGLKRTIAASPVDFPVGFDGASYNPLILANAGTTDDFTVTCKQNALINGTSGAPIAVDAAGVSWNIAEAVPGGSDLTLTAQWAAADELSGFTRGSCGIAKYNTGADWDLPPANMAAASGADPYTRTRTGQTPGVFMVADDGFMNKVLVSMKVFLQGPSFNATTRQMGDNLRMPTVLIPTTVPTVYTTGKFTPVGWQPATAYSVNASVFTPTGADAIVDWVFVFLKNPTTPFATIQTIPALIQRDGDVVGLDGTSPVAIPANAGSYILGIGHRNHLNIRLPNASPMTLNETMTTAYDFTTALAQAYKAAAIDPMKLIATSPDAYAMWAGDANQDVSVKMTGGSAANNDYLKLISVLGNSTAILSNIYSNQDLNMDRSVKMTGGSAGNNDYLKLVNVLGNSTSIITQSF